MGWFSRAWMALALTTAIEVSAAHLPDWRFIVMSVLVGAATWGLPDRRGPSR
jgi:hypothetical protein